MREDNRDNAVGMTVEIPSIDGETGGVADFGFVNRKWIKYSLVSLHLIITRKIFSREFVTPKIILHLWSCVWIDDTHNSLKILNLLLMSSTSSQHFVFSNS